MPLPGSRQRYDPVTRAEGQGRTRTAITTTGRRGNRFVRLASLPPEQLHGDAEDHGVGRHHQQGPGRREMPCMAASIAWTAAPRAEGPRKGPGVWFLALSAGGTLVTAGSELCLFRAGADPATLRG
jgi:hypothetical protein